MRNNHLLTKSKGERRPRNILFFDTETNVERFQDESEFHTLKYGFALFCFYDAHKGLTIQEEFEFTTPKEFCEYVVILANRYDQLYVVSHNIIYDIAAVHGLVLLPQYGYTIKSLYSKATTTIIKLVHNKRTINLIDNSNFFVGTLAKLSELTDVPKLKIDLDNCTFDELKIYCKRDVEIIYKLWQIWFKFLHIHEIGNFKLTTSSSAFEAFRHNHISHSISLHNNEQAITLERDSYHGGRVECKYLGYVEGNLYYLDVNSMYPYVMRGNVYPYRLYTYYENCPVETLTRLLAKYCVVAKVRITATHNAYPAMVNNKLCYPVGTFVTSLCTPELEFALKNDKIEEIYSLAYYAQDYLFTSFVDYFYTLRLKYKAEGNKTFEQLVKMILNGCYGKFGQKDIIQEVIGEANPEQVGIMYGYDASSGSYWTDTTLGGMVIRTTEGEVAHNAFPAIAAHVTSYARMHLFSLISQVPAGHYYYCDTDSLIVDDIGYDALKSNLHDTQLGCLKIEQTSSWLGILAPKTYNMDNRFKAKGIAKTARLIEQFRWKQQRWPKLGSMIANYGVVDYHTFPMEKQLSLINSAVNVSASGWTSPLQVVVSSEGGNVLA